jgi:hypothetical protein
VTNFFIKICPKNLHEYEDQAGNKRKHTKSNTHITGGASGMMGLKRSTGVCQLLRMSRTMTNDDLLNRSPWGFGKFHCQIGLL